MTMWTFLLIFELSNVILLLAVSGTLSPVGVTMTFSPLPVTSLTLTLTGLLGDTSADMKDCVEGKPVLLGEGDWLLGNVFLGFGDLSSTKIFLGFGLTL